MTVQDSGTWDQQFQDWYKRLDAFITAEEKDKTPRDQAWAAGVNKDIIGPIIALFKDRFGELPVKIQELDAKSAKVKKDDHLKRLKANRYAMFDYQKKAYLESAGDL